MAGLQRPLPCCWKCAYRTPAASPRGRRRHEAQQRDGLAQYGWLHHDGRSYGLQRLQDERYNISTAWAKRLCAQCGPGGDWGLRLEMQQRSDPQQQQQQQEGGQPGAPAASEAGAPESEAEARAADLACLIPKPEYGEHRSGRLAKTELSKAESGARGAAPGHASAAAFSAAAAAAGWQLGPTPAAPALGAP